MKMLSLVLALSPLSSTLFAAPQVSFSNDCRRGSASIQGNDIEFLNLNLDLTSDRRFQKQECDILVKFPAQSGRRIVVSQFQVEALADLDDRGIAFLSLQHNFNDEWRNTSRDVTVRQGSRALQVRDRAFKKMACGQEAFLRTQIVTSVTNGTLVQDNAAQVVRLNYAYENCQR